MFKLCTLFAIIVTVVNADVPKTTKPLKFGAYAVCCNIPPLGDVKSECFDNEQHDMETVSSRIQCAFEDLGLLTDKNNEVNKEKFKLHVLKWGENNKDWSAGVNMTIADCIDKEPQKSLEPNRNAYDMYACMGISMIAKCPKESWTCEPFNK